MRTAIHRRGGGGTPPPLLPLQCFEADSHNFASAPSVPRGFKLQNQNFADHRWTLFGPVGVQSSSPDGGGPRCWCVSTGQSPLGAQAPPLPLGVPPVAPAMPRTPPSPRPRSPEGAHPHIRCGTFDAGAGGATDHRAGPLGGGGGHAGAGRKGGGGGGLERVPVHT